MSKKLSPKALKLHTNAHADRDRPTLKDGDERTFRNGSFRDYLSKSSSKFKPVLTSSHSIIDDHFSKKITNDKTFDSDKTNNFTEIKSSEVEESSEVNNNPNYEQSNVERLQHGLKPSAILESKLTYIIPQCYESSSYEVSKLVFVILLSIMLLIPCVLLCNNEAISLILLTMIAVTSLISYVIYSTLLSINSLLASLENDCDIFEKAIQLSADVNVIHNKSYLSKTECLRSRYAKFLASQCVINKPKAVPQRDREPSRIPVKQLTRIMNKSRNVRKVIRKYIAKNVPMSSKIHCHVNNCGCNQHSVHCIKFKATRTRRSSFIKLRRTKHKIYNSLRRKAQCHKSLTSHISENFIYKYLSNTYNSVLLNVYKNGSHKKKIVMFELCTDIEKNPGPPVYNVDPSKTIKAPYSQGNVALFHENAGAQCVAMSLCALLYNYTRGINNSDDLVQVMNQGNQLYSIISQSTGQTFLLQTELPSQISMLSINYELQYSESYTGRISGDTNVEGYQYCMPINTALEKLISENYTSFILTVGCITVSVYCIDNGRLKIFDSHARDVYGYGDPQGTCVLLELSMIQNLVQHVQSLYEGNAIYELRGVHIRTQTTAVSQSMTDIICPCKQCGVIGLYAMCYSVIKPKYWNDKTLVTIVDEGNKLYDHMGINRHVTAADIPNTVSVCGIDISVNSKLHNGDCMLSFDSIQSSLETIIRDSIISNNGFLLWISGYCLTCIFHYTTKSKYIFSLLTYDESSEPAMKHSKNINGIPSLIRAICNVIQSKLINKEGNVYYQIQLLNCTCGLSINERKRALDAQRKKHEYAIMDPASKRRKIENIKQINRTAYMDASKKQELLNKIRQKYRTMDNAKKSKLLSAKKKQYHSMGSKLKQKLLKQRKVVKLNKIKNLTIDSCIRNFKYKIRQGPYYICCVCNRLLYKKSVIKFVKSKYRDENYFSIQTSFDGKQYICNTCHSKVLQDKIPCQAVVNNMHVDEIPTVLKSLEKLEQILIAKRIVFEKIVVMPKGQQRKIKGAICNVPVECDQTCQQLPRPPDRSGIILLKLKRKLQYRGHVYFQAVRPQFILHALQWLKTNNPLYSDIEIDIDNIDISMTTIHDANEPKELLDDNVDVNKEDSMNVNTNDDDEEEIEDPLNEHRSPINETCLQSIIPNYPVTASDNNEQSSGNEIYDFAPGENKTPVSFMNDKQCEEQAFPVLFPKGRFGYTVERDVKLSPVKYFNARLLHYSGRFATNPEYLFFAQFIIEQKKVSDSINVALKKVHGHSVTASQLRSNGQALQNLICQDQAYLFLRQIPGTPPYWQKFMYEVIAMVKQLGIPTWFMTLSCADLRWPELFQIIAKMQGKNLTNEQVDALSYNERCEMLNLNPVIVAKHFQYRVETFFTEVLLTDAKPIGKVVYYALRIEFQMRGSPHLHALIWTSDCPKLTSDNKQAYIDYIDQHVQAYLPREEQDAELHELVKTYQKHSHSRSCRKYKNIQCRFNFGQFFTERTILSEPLADDLNDTIKTGILEKRQEILCQVKQKIDEVLNPSKPNYVPTLTDQDIFEDIGITKKQYYSALSISPNSNYELHLKRPIDSCFINNYFIAGIKGFAANVDLQPVFDHYKCITYVCSYFTKDETECSRAIMNAAKEAKNANMNVRDGLRKIGAAFLSTREVSSQECVYRCMPELWLRKIFPGTVFVSTDLPDKRLRVAKTQKELDDLDDDSTDIYKSNIIERYSIRPVTIHEVDNLCLAEFAAYYYKDYRKAKTETIDAQPEILTDNDIEQQHTDTSITLLPEVIQLMNTNEKMKKRKIRAVIRYHRPNKRKEPELYFHHLLMLYYPWRNENDLLGNEQTYASKFDEPGVQTVVQQNRSIFEPDAEAVTEALEWLRDNQDNVIHSYDTIGDQENADIQLDAQEAQDDSAREESFNEQLPSHLGTGSQTNEQGTGAISAHHQPSEISDDQLRESVRSLNIKQREAYDRVLTWCRDKIKNLNSLKPNEVQPIYLFITGGAGAGKSHLIKAIYQTVVKNFRYSGMNPDHPTVLLTAPTGVAAINIDGTTVNTALGIPKEASDSLPPMSDQKRTQMRISLKELKLIIIDEISMVGNTTLIHIHQRLQQIFGTPNSHLFSGISVVAVGDLYQLPPIRRKPVFDDYKNDAFNLYHPWHVFQMIELTEIMRQKDDQPFTELLNRFRTASQTDDDIECIQSRLIDPSDAANYPTEALHIWAENKPVTEYNVMKLEQIDKPLYKLRAVDQYPSNVSQQDINRVLAKGRSETGGLDYEIHIKELARVMLTTNIDIADRLINGQMGTIIKIETNQITNKPTKIFIKFDDNTAGKALIDKSNNQFAKEQNAVPIEPILTRIKIRPNKPSSPEIQRMQFPITLAWACTVHKVQGLTLDKVVVSFELNRQRAFNYGQVYVAISRAKTLQGMHILGKVEHKHVRTNPKVCTEYERLRNIANHSHQSLVTQNTLLKVSLLNIRSLQKHSIDIKYDSNLTASDVIVLTETQLLPQSNDNEIVHNLEEFTLHRQDHTSDRYSSLALCNKDYITINQYHYFPGINAVKYVLSNDVNQFCIKVLLLYRKHSSNVPQYIDALHHILNSHDIDMILGDFNINYFNDDDIKPLKDMMDFHGYTQIVQSPTFVSAGTLLDHVYVTPAMYDITEHQVISVYYSDHDAVQLVITEKNENIP